MVRERTIRALIRAIAPTIATAIQAVRRRYSEGACRPRSSRGVTLHILGHQLTDHGAEAAAVHGLQRSDKWPEARAAHLVLEPTCMACGSAVDLQCHHVIPFHFCILLGRPELELNQGNLITLCEAPGYDHHLLLGHLDEFASANLEAQPSAQTWRGKSEADIKADAAWEALKAGRLPLWANMTDANKADLLALMNTRFPTAGEG